MELKLIALNELLISRKENPVILGIEKQDKYKKFLSRLNNSLTRQARSLFKDYSFQSAIEDGQIVAAVRHLISLNYFMREEEFENFYLWVGRIGVVSALDKIALAKRRLRRQEAGFFSEEALSALKMRAGALISHLDTTTKRQIATRVAKGLETGQSYYQIAEDLSLKWPKLSFFRSEAIVSTETSWAVGRSELESYKLMGVEYKRWVTAGDERTCEICVPLDNKEFAVKDKMVSDVPGWVNLPGNFAKQDDIIHPPLHIRCRCWLEPLLEKIGVPVALPKPGIAPVLREWKDFKGLRENSKSGVSTSFIAKDDQERRWFLKTSQYYYPTQEAVAERLAYRFGKQLGFEMVDTSLVKKSNQWWTASLDVGDFTKKKVQQASDFLDSPNAAKLDVEKKVKLDLFDYLIGNPDRHNHNWFVYKEGEKYIPVPIDQSLAEFGTAPVLPPSLEVEKKLVRKFKKEVKEKITPTIIDGWVTELPEELRRVPVTEEFTKYAKESLKLVEQW